MRLLTTLPAFLLLGLSVVSMAGQSLVNGSFEDGTLTGWTIWAQPWDTGSAEYHNPPVQQCVCSHGLTAADGQYFAGYTFDKTLVGHEVYGHVLFRQAIDVKNWDPDADRTNFNFEIWTQAAHSREWDQYEPQQQHILWWAEDGLMPHDTATVYMSGPAEDTDHIADGDTIEIDTAGVNRVYEFDVGDGIRGTSSVAVHVGSTPVTALLKYPRTMRDGDMFTLDAGGVHQRTYEFDTGDGVIRASSDVAIDISAANGGASRANAKAKTIEAINNDPAAPWTATDYANDKISLAWSAGYNARNTIAFGDSNSWITDFVYIGQGSREAKAALIAAINNDPFSPCIASDTGLQKVTLLTWKQTDSGGALNSNLNDAYGHIEVTNFGHLVGTPQHTTTIGDSYQAAEAQRSFTLSTVKSAFFMSGTTQNFQNWRHLKVSGSIPDNPKVVVLEIRLKIDGRPDQSHNVFDGVVFSAESATGSSIGKFVSDIPNGDFEVGPYNLIHHGPAAPNPPTSWILMRNWDGTDGPIEGYTNGVTDPTDPMGTFTPSGEHFWGRANPGGAAGSHLNGYWGHILQVRNWSPRATGVRYKLRYLSQMTPLRETSPLPSPTYPDMYRYARQAFDLCWDSEGTGHSILEPPLLPMSAEMLWMYANWFSWMRILDINDQSIGDLCASSNSGFVEIERAGEFSATDAEGNPYAPAYVLLRNTTNAYAGLGAVEPYKLMYDMLDFYVEAFPLPCNQPRTDFDADGDVDQNDFAFLQQCLTAEGGGISMDAPDCSCADLNLDGLHVNSADLAAFESCASGPGIPADPGCLIEACCMPYGGCMDLHPVECVMLGGTPQGSRTTCEMTSCP